MFLLANKKTMDLIKSFEGLHRLRSDGMVHVYPDAGYGWKWTTQGYGTTVNPDTRQKLKKGDPPITKDQALRWLRMDIERKYEPPVRQMVKVPLSEDSMGALVSFAYNCGTGALRRSTLLKRVNAKRWDDVPNQFLRWNKSNGKVFRGLTRRRKAEAKQFMEGLKKKPQSGREEPQIPTEAGTPVAVPLPPKNPNRRHRTSSWLLQAFLSWFK